MLVKSKKKPSYYGDYATCPMCAEQFNLKCLEFSGYDQKMETLYQCPCCYFCAPFDFWKRQAALEEN